MLYVVYFMKWKELPQLKKFEFGLYEFLVQLWIASDPYYQLKITDHISHVIIDR